MLVPVHKLLIVIVLLVASGSRASLQDTAQDAESAEQDDVTVEVADADETPPSAAPVPQHNETEWKYDKHGILILNGDNFDAAIDAFDFLLVDFFTPSCSQCVLLHPHFVQAWQRLQDTSAQFAMIDCSNETALLLHYGVVQFPTITFFKHQMEKMYDGGYRKDDIVTWIHKRMGPPALLVQDREPVELARQQHDVVVVGFFRDPKSTSVVLFNYVADVIHDYPFLLTSEAALFDEYAVLNDTVVVFRTFDDGRVDFDAGTFKSDELADFLRTETMPLVSELTMDNVWRVTDEHSPIQNHLLLFHNASADVKDHLMPAARQFKGRVLFLTLDVTDSKMMHMVDFFGIDRSALPALRLFRYDAAPTFKYRPSAPTADGELTSQLVLDFCQQFLKGLLKPFSLEQQLPGDWSDGPVLQLVASNYKQVTEQPARHVFVMLYAPWCSHCQRQLPVFQQLAELYSGHDSVALARMDATANEVVGLEVGSYPTYLLYPAGDQQAPVHCNESHTLTDLVLFLNAHTDVQLDLSSIAEVTQLTEQSEEQTEETAAPRNSGGDGDTDDDAEHGEQQEHVENPSESPKTSDGIESEDATGTEELPKTTGKDEL